MALGANKVVGVVVMMVCAYKWSAYLATLHENHFWFSNIKVIMKIPINTCGMVTFSTSCNRKSNVKFHSERKAAWDGFIDRVC